MFFFATDVKKHTKNRHENHQTTVLKNRFVTDWLVYSDLYPVRVVVQQQDTGAGHLLGFHHSLQISQ